MIDDEHNMSFPLHYLDTQQLRADTQVFRTYFHQNNIHLNGSFAYYDSGQYPDTMRQLLPSGTYNKCSLKNTFFICRPITDSSYPF
jgi:hypothetical protein